ncbi:MAG: hypothetical protein V1799_16405 [bacterium]
MFQVKHTNTISRVRILFGVLVAAILFSPSPVTAQGYDDAFEMRSKLKVEVQYADYGEYEYPEPILYQYGLSPYQQRYPYIVNFPERRGLIKFSRLVSSETVLGFKYQFSDLREDVKQHLFETKLTKTLDIGIIGIAAAQLLRDSRGFSAVQYGTGISWEPNAITLFQGDIQYYYRGDAASSVGGRLGTANARLKFRQVLTLSTALQAEYSFYNAAGNSLKFNSQSLALWLSQFFKTQTAIHVNGRFYTNTMGIQSFSPSLEIAQYIDWATVLWLKFRYYTNESRNVSFGEQGVYIPNGLRSTSVSAQVNHELTPSLLVYGKYRYYKSNLNIQMNTYLTGLVYSF